MSLDLLVVIIKIFKKKKIKNKKAHALWKGLTSVLDITKPVLLADIFSCNILTGSALREAPVPVPDPGRWSKAGGKMQPLYFLPAGVVTRVQPYPWPFLFQPQVSVFKQVKESHHSWDLLHIMQEFQIRAFRLCCLSSWSQHFVFALFICTLYLETMSHHLCPTQSINSLFSPSTFPHLSSASLKIGLDQLKGLFQLKLTYDSMIHLQGIPHVWSTIWQCSRHPCCTADSGIRCVLISSN